MRPSPTESATWYMPGTFKQGNDGNWYTVSISNSGVHRWVPASTSGPVYKFNVGDEVKIVQHGLGTAPEEVGLEVTIIERGHYSGKPGYKIYEPVGNSKKYPNGHYYGYDGFISEESFELIEQSTKIQKTKPSKMAKATKSITKKTTQEVRNIETSLINKEEVFKMLALAEATGLPLLLVGEPGVNSK
jgi:hypothetical protein